MNTTINSNNQNSGNTSIFRVIDYLLPYFYLILLIGNMGFSIIIFLKVYDINDINRKLQDTVERQQKLIDNQTAVNGKVDQVLLNQAEGRVKAVIRDSKLDTIKSVLTKK